MIRMKKPTTPYSKEFGIFLKEARLRKGLTQVEVSKRFGLDNSQQISQWERGVTGPSFENLVKLTHILDVPEKAMLKKVKEEQNKLFTREFQRLSAKYKTQTA